MRIRAFLAIDLSEKIRLEVERICETLRPKMPELKWIRADQLHLTVRFLGPVEEIKVPGLSQSLTRSLHGFKPFVLTLSTLGAFPDASHCRVLWFGVALGREECMGLRRRMDEVLVSSGFPKEGRAYEPHLTLARSRSNRSPICLNSAETKTSKVEMGHRVEEVILFRSDLSSTGPEYSVLSRMRF
jgi:2'-5' RNA ligase